MTGGEAAPGGARLRIDIAYDGTGFAGWAKQPGLRTVQGALEDALAQLLARTPPAPTLVVAGRTDAGVHATGQVAHLDLTDAQIASLDRAPRGRAADATAGEGPHVPSAERAAAALARRMNGVLGARSDVVVLACAPAPDGFDARFSATWRAYRYRISDAAGPRDPLQRHRTVEIPVELDAAVLQEAADALLGLHDFAAYCKPREGASTIRTLQELMWTRASDGALEARVRADAFCHSMVRALVGACVAAASGTRRRRAAARAARAPRADERVHRHARPRPRARARGLPGRRGPRGAERDHPGPAGGARGGSGRRGRRGGRARPRPAGRHARDCLIVPDRVL
ncbi:tRNA pseudouridine38-40 synthase [Clavibacter michiganensis]